MSERFSSILDQHSDDQNDNSYRDSVELVQQGWMSLLNEPSIGNAIRPKSWGPACWRFLDCLAFSYPCTPSHEQQADMAEFFHALKKVLPCYSCRTDFTKMMDEDPIERHLHSREALTRWLNGKHNNVNRKLGTTTMPYPVYVSNFVSEAPMNFQRTWTVSQLSQGRGGGQAAGLTGAQSSGPEKASWATPVLVIVMSVGLFLGLMTLMGHGRSARYGMGEKKTQEV